MGRVIRASLTGDRAQLGEVPARDFAELVIGVERALAMACGHLVGRRIKSTGRRERLIEKVTRLRLVAVKKGSVVGVLELPELTTADEEDLGLTAETLAEAALDRTLAAAAGEPDGYRDVIRVLVRLTETLGVGTRYDAVKLEESRRRKRRPAVTLDLSAREHLRSLLEPGAKRADGALTGVLVEADFEHRTARLRTSGKQAIEVRFDAELADGIQEALRIEASFEGDVAYDRETLLAKSVKLRQISRPVQLILDSGAAEFWTELSVPQLAVEQGVALHGQLISDLKDLDATPDEIEAFFAALKSVTD